MMRFASERPFNGGPRLQDLTKSFYTPNELHYARNHAPVPRVDPEDYVLTINANPAIGLKGAEFTLSDLKTKFKPHAVSLHIIHLEWAHFYRDLVEMLLEI